MVTSQLKDQLPGGKYWSPPDDIRDETRNCPRTNVISERDFASYDRCLSMKPTLSTISACGIIMFNNNRTGEWLKAKTEEELKDLVTISRTNRRDFIKKYRDRKNRLIIYKLDEMDRKKLEKEMKDQKTCGEKEFLTMKIDRHGGLIVSVEAL